MKNTSVKITAKAAFVALFSIGLASCASTADIDSIRSMAEQAQQTASQMEDRLKQAEDNASEALATAKEADQKADEAKQCCDANTDRMDRMFKKLQQK